MAITRTAFLTELQGDLEEYGEWDDHEVGAPLDTALLYAMRDFSEKRDWSFKFDSDSLVVSVDGLQGPYTPPSGFDSLVTPERVSRYFDYDRFAVPPPIPDGVNGLKYELTHDRLNNELWFRHRPAAGTYPFYFRKALVGTVDLATWPDAARRFLSFQTKYYLLVNSEDTAKQAKLFEQEAQRAYISLLHDLRRGESKQDTREPQDVYGYPLAQGYANEGDGFLGGEG